MDKLKQLELLKEEEKQIEKWIYAFDTDYRYKNKSVKELDEKWSRLMKIEALIAEIK